MALNNTVYNAISNNSLLFLIKAITQLTKESDVEKPIERQDAILVSVYIQLALELAIKAIVVKKTGFKNILNITKHNNDTEEDLLRKFESNDVKVKEFEKLKNYIKKNQEIFGLNKKQISYIEKFQKYRNKIVHINYNFTIKELEEIKKDLIIIIVHIIIKLLAKREDKTPSEFYIKHLDIKNFETLINYPLYRKEMAAYVKQMSSTIYYCPICSNDTLSYEELFCYTCLSSLDIFGFLDCDYCKVSNVVIYDKLNIHNNKHIIRGLCLNCKEYALVYECPVCGVAYNMDTQFLEDIKCKDGICNG